MALKAAGGAAGFPLTIATLQLGVGCIYALFLWVSPFSLVPHLLRPPPPPPPDAGSDTSLSIGVGRGWGQGGGGGGLT